MKNSQVINTNEDSVLAFDGDNVIYNSGIHIQEPVGITGLITSIPVDITFYDLMTGSYFTVSNITMSYIANVDFWSVNNNDVKASLTDRHKYVALVVEHAPGTNNMRQFKIDEFCVDNDSFEATWMRLPYQVEIGAESKIAWYSDTTWTTKLFKAAAYQGGTGTTHATSTANVTHRGAITPV